jgi:cell division protein ZapA (FtsZ GTPase activity inhibitor)
MLNRRPININGSISDLKSRNRIIAMEQFGVILGIGLLALVSACAFLLGHKAAKNVAQFREEHHESFMGKKQG